MATRFQQCLIPVLLDQLVRPPQISVILLLLCRCSVAPSAYCHLMCSPTGWAPPADWPEAVWYVWYSVVLVRFVVSTKYQTYSYRVWHWRLLHHHKTHPQRRNCSKDPQNTNIQRESGHQLNVMWSQRLGSGLAAALWTSSSANTHPNTSDTKHPDSRTNAFTSLFHLLSLFEQNVACLIHLKVLLATSTTWK